MPQISIYVSEEQKQAKKKLNLKWSNILDDGFRKKENEHELAIKKAEYDELEKEFIKLNTEHIKRGQKLQRYIEKYGLDEEIVYGQKIEVQKNAD